MRNKALENNGGLPCRSNKPSFGFLKATQKIKLFKDIWRMKGLLNRSLNQGKEKPSLGDTCSFLFQS